MFKRRQYLLMLFSFLNRLVLSLKIERLPELNYYILCFHSCCILLCVCVCHCLHASVQVYMHLCWSQFFILFISYALFWSYIYINDYFFSKWARGSNVDGGVEKDKHQELELASRVVENNFSPAQYSHTIRKRALKIMRTRIKSTYIDNRFLRCFWDAFALKWGGLFIGKFSWVVV